MGRRPAVGLKMQAVSEQTRRGTVLFEENIRPGPGTQQAITITNHCNGAEILEINYRNP